jgi:hypothetical protein
VGYKPKRTLYQLTFEDPDLEGLEITTRRVSVDGLMKFVDMFETVQQVDKDNFKPSDLKILKDMFEAFTKVLVSWNIEDDDDQPVPRTVEGLLSLDIEFVLPVIEAWITGMVQAPPPLPAAASSGETSQEASLALASQSQSRPSS